MKALVTTIIAIFLVIDFAVAQSPDPASPEYIPSEKILKMAPANYLRGLQRDNLGVVESSMLNLMKLRTVYPQGDYEKILAELEKLQSDGKTKSIRFMAFITDNFIKSPDRFTWLDQNNLTVMDSTLAIVGEKLRSFDQ
jgi:hypothetical protein